MNDITLQSVTGSSPLAVPAKQAAKEPQGSGFGEILNKSIEAVNNQMMEADQLVQGLVSGQHANIHETMIALEKAGVSFRLMARVQSKLIEAYKEVARMQL